MNAFWEKWRVAVGLLVLCIIPVAAGMCRVAQIISNAPVTEKNIMWELEANLVRNQ